MSKCKCYKTLFGHTMTDLLTTTEQCWEDDRISTTEIRGWSDFLEHERLEGGRDVRPGEAPWQTKRERLDVKLLDSTQIQNLNDRALPRKGPSKALRGSSTVFPTIKLCIGDPKATLAGTGELEDLGTVKEPVVEACTAAWDAAVVDEFFAELSDPDGY